MMSRLVHALMVILLACLAGLAALPARAAERESLRLSDFTTKSGPIRLGDVYSSTDLYIPLSALVSLHDVRVDLRFANSIALQGKRSYLLVRLNDISAAQIPLDPTQPAGSARFSLPDELWKPGFNRLSISVIQHYTDRCEDALAPELWTELDLYRSRLEFTAQPTTRPLALSDLSAAFGPGIGAIDSVTLVTAAQAQSTPVYSQALPLVAQALALRRKFRPLHIDSLSLDGKAELPAQPQVLIGTPEQLAGLLPADTPRPEGPQLIISRSAAAPAASARPQQLRLLVSGRTPEEVVEAARTLALMDDALNPVGSLTVQQREQAPGNRTPLSRLVLHPDTSYEFADLGLPTHDMRGFGAHGVGLDIRLPADYYIDDSAQAELLLDLGYGAGMGPGSVMNIFLNGEFIHGRLLDESGGALFNRYRIVLPARRLHPGPNRLDFEFTLRPQAVTGECAGIDGRHLVTQLMGSSTLRLPGFGRASQQPNLNLFSRTGYPFNSQDPATIFDLYAARPDQAGAALTLLGRLTQSSGVAHDGWRLHNGTDGLKEARRGVLVGTADALPADISAGWSVAFGRLNRWPYSALNDLRSNTNGDASVSGYLAGLLGLHPAPAPRTPSPDSLHGSITQVSGLGPQGGLTLQRNPLASGSSPLLIVTAENAALLGQRVDNLVDPAIWTQLDGDLMLWGEADQPVVTGRVAERFEIGDGSSWLLLRLWMSNQPWYWLALVLLGTILLVVCVLWLLRKRQARQATGH